jgi:hypothetical protein
VDPLQHRPASDDCRAAEQERLASIRDDADPWAVSADEHRAEDPTSTSAPTAPTTPSTCPTRHEVTGIPMDHKDQKTQPAKGPIPHRQGNGYYAHHATGKRLRSVTTVIEGGVPKPSLIFWAAGLCVDAAIEALPQLVAASRFPDQLLELSRWLKRAHTQAKEERGDVGSVVHKIIECHILGSRCPSRSTSPTPGSPSGGSASTTRRSRRSRSTSWRSWRDWQVEFTASEMVVANPDDGYAGTLDFIAVSPLIAAALRAAGFNVADDEGILGDTKSGGELDRLTSAKHYHGVYPEAGLQMSAYKHAKVAWLKQTGDEVPMPATACVGIVLHLRPEGYRIYPARCDEQVYRYFRHAQMVDEFTSKIASPASKTPVISPPLQLPSTNEAVA